MFIIVTFLVIPLHHFYLLAMERNEFLISLGSRIREIRKQKKMTQEQLSNVCEFEKANLSRIESGLTNPTILTLLKMSRALEVRLSDFFDAGQ